MSRELILDTDSQILRPVVFCYLEIGTSPYIRVCNYHTIEDGEGNIWYGIGNLGTISVIEESDELKMHGINLSLTSPPGVNNRFDYINDALNTDWQWKTGNLYIGLLDENMALFDGHPKLIFSGQINNITIDAGETFIINVSLESFFVDWQRPRIRRYTYEDQIKEFPDDMGLQFASKTTEMEIIWGRT